MKAYINMFGLRNKYLDLLFIATNHAFYFAVKMFSAYYICCIYSNAFQNTLTMEANTMNLGQTGL